MKNKLITILVLFLSTTAFGQETDTLSFYSEAFNETRTVFVHKPEFYKYMSDSVKLPVIYLLDGQHEWFINPLLSDIKYLQYTHEIPNALVVVIPHNNRNLECGITNLETELPLDKFITSELDNELEKYHPGHFRVIIGHSFSASFSLYSYYKHPGFYSAVIANTPFDEMEMLVNGFQQSDKIDKTKISISTGGIAGDKDFHHREKYNQLKTAFPEFFNTISVFEADYSAHNAVPIVATPSFLTKIFKDFSSRYTKIAEVNDEYRLISNPESLTKEISKISEASKIGNFFYPPEIADINGIASRYSYSGYDNYAAEVYTIGTKYYPRYYDFCLSLYDLLKTTDKERARLYLDKAVTLLTETEKDWEGKDEILKEIEAEKTKNGW